MDMTAIGDKLRGAKVIHNHPDSKDYYGDCFSMEDFRTFFVYRLKRLEVISGLGWYSLEYEGKPISSEKSELLYKNAELYVMDRALQTGNEIESMQLEIMKRLNQTVPGLKLRSKKMTYEEELALFIKSAKEEREKIYDEIFSSGIGSQKAAELSQELQRVRRKQNKEFRQLRAKYHLPPPEIIGRLKPSKEGE